MLLSIDHFAKENPLRKKKIAEMKRRVNTLQRQLGQVGPVMRGTVVWLGARHKQPYFSLHKEKKTRLIYLGKDREPAARKLSANYKSLLAIVEEMTLLNMELLKQNALD
jgi:hypothetical protein